VLGFTSKISRLGSGDFIACYIVIQISRIYCLPKTRLWLDQKAHAKKTTAIWRQITLLTNYLPKVTFKTH
jgi:hypothetical protein